MGVKDSRCQFDTGPDDSYLTVFVDDPSQLQGLPQVVEHDTIVVGGGAAGIMAAISAATTGARVALVESNRQPGRKILISGNGRCNLTNVDADQIAHYHSGKPRFITPVLEKFSVADALDFFFDLGVVTKEEKRGRLFPTSDQAQSVVDLLLDRLAELGVEVICGTQVTQLSNTDGLQVKGTDGIYRRARRVVLASGGISLAKLGANRSGIELATALGHSCTELYPGLVPLVSSDPYLHRMHGVKVTARVQATVGRGRTLVDTDDLLFTKYGVSGFTILNLSVQLVEAMAAGPVELDINLLPGYKAEQVSELLLERWRRHPHRSLLLSFAGMLSTKLAGPLLERIGMEPQAQVSTVTKAQRWQLAQGLTALPVTVSEPRPFDHAEVTVGGIETSEIDPQTLESYLVSGLYFAGEMLDVQGDLGGYNFQWAWASGHLAGEGRS